MARLRHPRRNVFVLSGGGARGAGQVGMLQALLEAGIRPHTLVGCSVGALNATYLAQDPTLDTATELAHRWSGLKTRDVFAGGVLTKATNLIRLRPYLYSPDGLDTIINTWVPNHRRLEDLPTPVRVVTTQLSTGRPRYHDSGSINTVLRASTALPGLFPPVEVPDPNAGKSTTHIDGGVSDLVPLSGALGLGATHVYVLDVTVPPLTDKARTPLDMLVASLGISMRLRGTVDFGKGVSLTHIRATGNVRTGLTDFTHTDELVDRGHQAALEALATEPAEPAGRFRLRWGHHRSRIHST